MQIIETSASFTRPGDTTAYASGDLIANNTSAGSVTPLTFYIPYGKTFEITRVAVVRTGNVTLTGAIFRIHLFKDSPTVSNGDNAAIVVANTPNYVGFLDVDQSTTGTITFASGQNGSGGASPSVPFTIVADPDQLIYGLLEARGAYVPVNQEVLKVVLTGKAYV